MAAYQFKKYKINSKSYASSQSVKKSYQFLREKNSSVTCH